jgi:hypothetical protein
MSFNGTVTCKHCWETGHNRRGCPKLKEVMLQRLVEDPEDWRAKRYFEKKKGATVRRCTYCNLKGHNRATCTTLKGEVSEWKHKNSNWRKAIVEELLAAGMGVGALIKHGDLSWQMTERQNLVMVKGINPEASINAPYNALVVQGIIKPTQYCNAKLPDGVLRKVSEKVGGNIPEWGTSVTVMSETKHCHLRTIPNHEEWLQGGTEKWVKKEIFANKQCDDFYENKYKE